MPSWLNKINYNLSTKITKNKTELKLKRNIKHKNAQNYLKKFKI